MRVAGYCLSIDLVTCLLPFGIFISYLRALDYLNPSEMS